MERIHLLFLLIDFLKHSKSISANTEEFVALSPTHQRVIEKNIICCANCSGERYSEPVELLFCVFGFKGTECSFEGLISFYEKHEYCFEDNKKDIKSDIFQRSLCFAFISLHFEHRFVLFFGSDWRRDYEFWGWWKFHFLYIIKKGFTNIECFLFVDILFLYIWLVKEWTEVNRSFCIRLEIWVSSDWDIHSFLSVR